MLAITWKKYSTKQKLCYNIICNALCLINYTVLIFSSLYWQIFIFFASLAIFANLWHSLAILGHLCQCLAINFLRSLISMKIFGKQSMAIFGRLWQSSAIFGTLWRSLVIFGDLWQSLVIVGDLWRSLAIFGDLQNL